MKEMSKIGLFLKTFHLKDTISLLPIDAYSIDVKCLSSLVANGFTSRSRTRCGTGGGSSRLRDSCSSGK